MGSGGQIAGKRRAPANPHQTRLWEVYMPKRSWDGKHQRQFERIREQLLFQGEAEGVADEVAARRVNRDVPLNAGRGHLAMVAQIRSNLRHTA